MKALRWVQRRLIPILTVVAVSALFLSTFSVVQYTQQQTEQRRQASAYDLQSCERGNDLRRVIVGLGEADAQLTRDLLDVLLGLRATTPESQEAVAALLQRLEPSFDKQEAAVAAVEITDCVAAVNRSKETP